MVKVGSIVRILCGTFRDYVGEVVKVETHKGGEPTVFVRLSSHMVIPGRMKGCREIFN